jgi:opacity protein-like surface antigen
METGVLPGKAMTRFLFIFILGAAIGVCQPFTAGVKAGVPLNDLIDTATTHNLNYLGQTNRYIFGVTAELRLPFGLGVEVDALYRHLNYSATAVPGIATITQSLATTSNVWEFPILAKYRFSSKGPLQPYIDGGLAWDTLQGLNQVITTGNLSTGVSTTTSTSHPSELNQSTTRGIVLGAGIDIHALLIHLQPEIRYTRWGAQNFLDPNGGIHSSQNQAEFLVGITF